MDDNTVEVLRVAFVAIFGIGAFWAIMWGMTRTVVGNGWVLPEQPTFTYYRYEPPDDDDWEDERQELRDRLAAALWENRQLKRRPVDDKVEWLSDEYTARLREWGEA